jgi:hypothetical protein
LQPLPCSSFRPEKRALTLRREEPDREEFLPRSDQQTQTDACNVRHQILVTESPSRLLSIIYLLAHSQAESKGSTEIERWLSPVMVKIATDAVANTGEESTRRQVLQFIRGQPFIRVQERVRSRRSVCGSDLSRQAGQDHWVRSKHANQHACRDLEKPSCSLHAWFNCTGFRATNPTPG